VSHHPQPPVGNDDAALDFDLERLAGIPDPLSPQLMTASAAASTQAEASAGGPLKLPGGRRLTRAQSRALRGALFGAALLWLVGRLGNAARLGAFDNLPLWYSASHVVLPSVLGLILAVLALRGGKLGLGSTTAQLVGGTLGAISVFWLAAMLLPSLNPVAPEPMGTVRCMNHTLLWLLGPLVLCAASVWRYFPAGSRWRCATLGASAGLFAGAATNLQCSGGGHLHMALGHGASAVLAALVGGMLIARSSQA